MDEWRHYMQQLGERGIPSYEGDPTADDDRKALHRSGEVPMPGYLPYDPYSSGGMWEPRV